MCCNNFLFYFFVSTMALGTTFLPNFHKNNETPDITFAVISDPQLHDPYQRINKLNAVKNVFDVDFVLFPGDLTSRGWNMIPLNLISDQFYKDGVQNETQLDDFVKNYIEPIERSNIPTYSVMGNHDTYTGPMLPVKYWITKKHSGIYYKTEYSKYYDIIGLHIYPNKEISDWLADVINPAKKSILFFHFPPSGAFSDWWTTQEKEYFYKSIEQYKSSILLLCVGHFHFSETYIWNDMIVVNGGGDTVAKVHVIDGKIEEISWH